MHLQTFRNAEGNLPIFYLSDLPSFNVETSEAALGLHHWTAIMWELVSFWGQRSPIVDAVCLGCEAQLLCTCACTALCVFAFLVGRQSGPSCPQLTHLTPIKHSTSVNHVTLKPQTKQNSKNKKRLFKYRRVVSPLSIDWVVSHIAHDWKNLKPLWNH